MDKLPPQCRKVFILHYIEGKKISEIAEELKISIGTVKTHKVRGIDLLTEVITGFVYFDFNFLNTGHYFIHIYSINSYRFRLMAYSTSFKQESTS